MSWGTQRCPGVFSGLAIHTETKPFSVYIEIEYYMSNKAVVGGTAGPAMAGPLFWPKMVLAGPLFRPIIIFLPCNFSADQILSNNFDN